MASTRRLTPVELRLVVVDPQGGSHDVAVEAAPDVRAGELLAAIGRELGLDASAATLAGEPVPGDVPVSELGLRWGDELLLGRGPAKPAAAHEWSW